MSGTHLSREFFDLVKAIGEAKSKQEEDQIISNEVAVLKKKLAEPISSKKKMKEYIIRLIYVEMLGHDASFAYIKAVELCASSDLLQKRVGYLAAGLLLSPEHEFRFMLVNQLQRDMKSNNHFEVSVALVALCKLLTRDMIPAVVDIVVNLLKHEREIVRKKAVMALHRCLQLDDSSVSHLGEHFRRTLCDKDPAVMGATLNVLLDQAKEDPNAFKDLISSFVSVLKQITEHRLPRDFDYHRMPAPWIQIKLLKILAVLGAADKAASEGMYEVLHDVMRRADTGINVGYAIIYEAVRTVTSIYPNNTLLDAAALAISRFITSDNHNLKYLGVTGLASIVKDHPKYAAEHQMVVMDCLESTDETLRRKTLELLYQMTNPQNVVVITDKLLDFLRGTHDTFLRQELVTRITQLAERFAPSNQWFLRTMTTVFELGGDLVQAEVAENLITLLAEGSGDDDEADEALRQEAADAYMALASTEELPDVLLAAMCWLLGEYGYTSKQHSLQEVMDAVVSIAERPALGEATRAAALSAISKLAAQLGNLPPSAAALTEQYALSQSVDLQQRAREMQALATDAMLMQAVLPVDAACEDIDVDKDLSFLNDFVQSARAAGAKEYSPPEDLDASTRAKRAGSGLRFDAYDAPTMPTRGSTSVSVPSATEAGPFAGLDKTVSPPAADTDTFAAGTVQSGLNLSGVKAVWGAEGFAGSSVSAGAKLGGPSMQESAPAPEPAPEPAPAPSQSGFGADSGVSGGGGGGGGAYEDEWEYVEEEVEDAEDSVSQQRQQSAAALFAGIAPAAAPRKRTVRKKVLKRRAQPAASAAPAQTFASEPAPAAGGGDDLLGFGMSAPAPAPAGGGGLDFLGTGASAPAPAAAGAADDPFSMDSLLGGIGGASSGGASGGVPDASSLSPSGSLTVHLASASAAEGAAWIGNGDSLHLAAQRYHGENLLGVVLYAYNAASTAVSNVGVSLNLCEGMAASVECDPRPQSKSASGAVFGSIAPGGSAKILIRMTYENPGCMAHARDGSLAVEARAQCGGSAAAGRVPLSVVDIVRPVRIQTSVFGQQWPRMGAGEGKAVAAARFQSPTQVLGALPAKTGLHAIEAIGKTGDGILAGRMVGSDVPLLVYTKVTRPGAETRVTVRSANRSLASAAAAVFAAALEQA